MNEPTQAESDARSAAATGDARPLRADARRNRQSILAAAVAAFATAENDAVSLEGIAHDAGVGIGTLYRHFPNRESLVEAVYAAELDDVVASAGRVLQRLPPDAALRAWMDRYARFAATKRGMIDTLRAGWAAGRITTPGTRSRITAAIATILAAGARDGSLRADVEPDDLTAMLLGVFVSMASSGVSEQTNRMLDLIVDALRPRHDE